MASLKPWTSTDVFFLHDSCSLTTEGGNTTKDVTYKGHLCLILGPLWLYHTYHQTKYSFQLPSSEPTTKIHSAHHSPQHCKVYAPKTQFEQITNHIQLIQQRCVCISSSVRCCIVSYGQLKGTGGPTGGRMTRRACTRTS